MSGNTGASFDPLQDDVVWIADTGLFIACGRPQNAKFKALRAFVQRHELSFRIPRRVYEELSAAPDGSTPAQLPIDSAIDAGWVTIADGPEYTNGIVSQVMDDVRTFIARASHRREDHIEKADTALAGVAAECLMDQAQYVYIVTTDIDAGKGAVSALSNNGFADRVQFKNGFNLLEEIR